MLDQTQAIPMTLNAFQGHAPTKSLFKCDFSYSSAAVDKISTDIARRAILSSSVAELLV